MNILFCNEGYIIDGVASYNLYLSASLHRAGNNVSIVGKWTGRKGFQNRHNKWGVKVLQCPSFTTVNPWLLHKAKKAMPDVIITDARRSFPLSQRIKEKTGAKVVTVFHDPPKYDKRHGRSLNSLIKGSSAWVTAERPIYEELKKITKDLPIYWFQRPISGLINSTRLPPREPFRILYLGRLSGWKSWGVKVIIDNAVKLKKAIPSLEITVVGGGGRYLNTWWTAKKANARVGNAFVHVVGTQTDPQPWMEQATMVFAGATSAIEVILSNRPVFVLSGFWMGLITKKNIDSGISCHFGDRQGPYCMKCESDVICNAIIDFYNKWDEALMEKHVNVLRERLSPDFNSETIAGQFNSLLENL